MRAATFLLVALAPMLGCESEVPRPQPGQTCFGLEEQGRDGEEFCPKSACFQEAFTFSAVEPEDAIFHCKAAEPYCPPPTPEEVAAGDLWSRGFILDTEEFRLELRFDERLLLDGYSLENFRTYLDDATVHFSVAPDFSPVYGYSSPDEVEFASYEGGVLEVRVAGRVTYADTTIDTPPYLCRSPTGIGWRACETKKCWYRQRTSGSGEPVRVTVQAKAPIQPIQP